jgi:hypothetical protein
MDEQVSRETCMQTTRRALLAHDAAPALEFLEWADGAEGAILDGTLVGSEAGDPLRLTYHLETRADGTARRVAISVRTRESTRDLVLTADGYGHWFVQGVPVPVLTGCLDLTLWATPSPQQLILRRLSLPFGERRTLAVAWVADSGLALRTAHYRIEHVLGRAEGHQYRVGQEESGRTDEVWVDREGFIARAGTARRLA